jgi:peptidoglycan/xylan/chitin deacetylase (PgdA/CDA1 family)
MERIKVKFKIILLISKIARMTKLYEAFYLWNARKFDNKYIRVVNYHSTPIDTFDNFEKQIKFFLKYYEPVNYKILHEFLTNKIYPYAKPGILLTFDDGLSTNYDMALNVLDKYNICGWFFISPELVGKDAGFNLNETYMNWDQIKELSKNHEIGCHTMTHRRLVKNIPLSILKHEILDSKKEIELNINRSVHSFCWVGGEINTYTKDASEMIKKSNYEFSFMTNSKVVTDNTNPLQIQRTNIESNMDIDETRLRLSGITDIYYRKKRIIIEESTK